MAAFSCIRRPAHAASLIRSKLDDDGGRRRRRLIESSDDVVIVANSVMIKERHPGVPGAKSRRQRRTRGYLYVATPSIHGGYSYGYGWRGKIKDAREVPAVMDPRCGSSNSSIKINPGSGWKKKSAATSSSRSSKLPTDANQPWWRDPETGGINGVARRSVIAAIAQLAFAAVAVKGQRLYDVWRGESWGESSWQRRGKKKTTKTMKIKNVGEEEEEEDDNSGGGGRAEGVGSSFLERWKAEEEGWRERQSDKSGV